MNHKIATGIILVLIFIVCIGMGIYIYKINEISNTKLKNVTEVAQDKITDECTEEAEELAAVNSIEKKVSANAIFIMYREYKKCGHTTKKYETAPQFTVNLNQEELQKMYENWEIKSFSNNEIVMKKTEEGICDEHFVLRDEEGQIAIYQLDENNGEKIIERTGIIVRYLPEEDKENIENGIYVNGNEALNRLLENFE